MQSAISSPLAGLGWIPRTLRNVLYQLTLLHIRQTISMAPTTEMCPLTNTVGDVFFKAQIISFHHSAIPSLHLKGDRDRA